MESVHVVATLRAVLAEEFRLAFFYWPFDRLFYDQLFYVLSASDATERIYMWLQSRRRGKNEEKEETEVRGRGPNTGMEIVAELYCNALF